MSSRQQLHDISVLSVLQGVIDAAELQDLGIRVAHRRPLVLLHAQPGGVWVRW